jgi:hypothetical protein
MMIVDRLYLKAAVDDALPRESVKYARRLVMQSMRRKINGSASRNGLARNRGGLASSKTIPARAPIGAFLCAKLLCAVEIIASMRYVASLAVKYVRNDQHQRQM